MMQLVIYDDNGEPIDRFVKESDMIERFQLLQDQIDDLKIELYKLEGEEARLY